jgi:hypothetical protein
MKQILLLLLLSGSVIAQVEKKVYPEFTAAQHMKMAMNRHYVAVGSYVLAAGVGVAAVYSPSDDRKALSWTAGVICAFGVFMNVEAWSHFGSAARAMEDHRVSMASEGIGVRLRF